MNVIFLMKRYKQPVNIHLSRPWFIGMLVLAVLLPMSAAAYMGFYLGMREGEAKTAPSALQAQLSNQRQQLEEAARAARENINALGVRLSSLQAKVIRMEALGVRLVEMAGLDKREFNFANPPAQGGPEPAASGQAYQVPDFLKSLDDLGQKIDDREVQLSALESLYINRNLRRDVQPAGQPVENGWVSSYFGLRADPLTGVRAHHDGVDIAGEMGASISAVGSGVVTWSAERSGYGLMVEINHGNGYVTRYAHNQRNLVAVGDSVKRGQAVALLGSSGRSTGPHLHFEVLYNGQMVNPVKYLQAAR